MRPVRHPRRSWPRAAALMLGVAQLLTGAVPIAYAADNPSDIPGVPLPGPIAAGRLGGAIYDVVYRLNVPAGHVIVASLTGTPGTDHDLYLFDSTATTVLSEVGLLTKSIGPESTEAVSWPSRLGGTYYINLNGATDVEGDYRLTVQTIPDATPPALTVRLADGKASTNQNPVPVTLAATEDLSGVTEMAFSTDGANFGAWQPFQVTSMQQISPGDGTKTVWAKVRNGVGLESAPASDTVLLDTTPPSVVTLSPPPSTSVASLRPTFQVTFSEPILPSSWTDLGLIVQTPAGTLLSGAYSYDATKRVGSFTPAEAMQPGTSHVVTVGLVRDLAGNPVAPLASWSVTPLAPTAFRLSTTAGVVPVGGSATVSVELAGGPRPAAVEMLASTAGGPFGLVSTFDLSNGRLSLSVAPPQNTVYRFRYSGAFGVAPAEGDIRLLVRRSISLSGRSSAVVSRGTVGRPVSLVAVVGPPKSGLSVSFRLYRFDTTRRAWVYAGSKGRSTDVNGRATLTWVPTATGSYYWRVAVGSTPEYANNTSATYRWSISR